MPSTPRYNHYPTMMDQQQQHSVAAAASTAMAAAQQEQTHAPDFSFNDEPVFAIDDEALLTGTAQHTTVGSADDFFSSPEWTDPSPALTTSMSFNLDSCDTSPLLTDINEAPELAGMPLFGDQVHFSLFQQQQSNIAQDAATATAAATAKRSPQMAFSRAKEVNEQSAMLLLRAFNTSAISNAPGVEDAAAVADTASPTDILSPLVTTKNTTSFEHDQQQQRGTKRRLVDATDLLPIDAPIQPRCYKTPSSTSRKGSAAPGSVVEDAIPSTPDMSNMDPLSAKRLSNTLAARRSRHRKAAELKELHDTITDLTEQVEMWKRRCIRAEQERDQAFGSLSS